MLILESVERRSGLTKDSFAKEYLQPEKPVIFTDLMDSWAGKTKWTPTFFKDNYGHLQVPVTSPNFSKPGKGYMEPDLYMSFKEYLDILEAGPMQYRIFLWNIFKHAPELIKDFSIPKIMDGFFNDYPFMFFGGQGASTAMHFDVDLSHVFLNQIFGRKRVVLFPHDQSVYLYHLPYSVASYVDINNPDYAKYPALTKAKGFEVILQPGETLFMPSGYWHYIEYLDGGYSISLRANESYVRRMRGAVQITKHLVVDRGMNRLMGEEWRKIKTNMAIRRAQEALSA